MVVVLEIPRVAREQALMRRYFSHLMCHVANVSLVRASALAKPRVIVGGDNYPLA